MSTDIMRMRNHLHKKAHFLKILDHDLSCLITIHTEVFARYADRCIIIHDTDLRKVMASSDLKVIRIMGRCDLYAAGTKFLIYIFIRNNRDLSVCKRKL